jgi:hypothetical protein
MAALETELDTYRDNLPKMLLDEGKFALIHGHEVAGIFDTYADALNEGYKLFKLEQFLVKQIQAVEQAHFLCFAVQ